MLDLALQFADPAEPLFIPARFPAATAQARARSGSLSLHSESTLRCVAPVFASDCSVCSEALSWWPAATPAHVSFLSFAPTCLRP